MDGKDERVTYLSDRICVFYARKLKFPPPGIHGVTGRKFSVRGLSSHTYKSWIIRSVDDKKSKWAKFFVVLRDYSWPGDL